MTTQQELAEMLAGWPEDSPGVVNLLLKVEERDMAVAALRAQEATRQVRDALDQMAAGAPPNIGDAPRKELADMANELWAKLCHECHAPPGLQCDCKEDIEAAFEAVRTKERAYIGDAKDEVPAVGKWPSEEKIIRAIVIVAVRDSMSPPLSWTDGEVIMLATQSHWRIATIQARAVLALTAQPDECAIRNAALEEAAKVAEQYDNGTGRPSSVGVVIATFIRGLNATAQPTTAQPAGDECSRIEVIAEIRRIAKRNTGTGDNSRSWNHAVETMRDELIDALTAQPTAHRHDDGE